MPWQSFVHPWLLAGLALIALPILIHLIHRFRFKRVRWAAMSFLLDSQRRNRRRLMWEHLLLLLLRCALVVLVVLMVARPETASRMAELLSGGKRTEHVILLDDSMSMRQVVGSGTAFDAACQAIASLASQLADQSGVHSITILRATSPDAPDLLATRVDDTLVDRLPGILRTIGPSHSADSAANALAEAAQLMTDATATSRVVHVFSDFQVKDWRAESDVYAPLRELAADDVAIRLVDTVESPTPNFAVVTVSAKIGAVASGVPFAVESTIRNFAETAATQITVSAYVDGQPLPTQSIDRLEPNESKELRFDVLLPTSGVHEIAIDVREDGLAADNRRWLSVEVPAEIPVLIVDGSRDRRDSLYLALALAPGGGVNTGLSPQVTSISALRTEDLSQYRAVYLLNVAQVDSESAARLTEYVERSGGVGVFLGAQVDPNRYNETLFLEGRGLLPAPLGSRRNPSPDPLSTLPDLQPMDHPIFRVFAGERNSFLDTIAIREIVEIDENAMAEESNIIARHRDGSPVAVEKSMGQGRVILFLTTAGDAWNSWPQNPTYVVAMLLLNEHLSQSVQVDADGVVGDPWSIRFDSASFRPTVQIVRPTTSAADKDIEWLNARVENDRSVVTFEDTSHPGIYKMVRTAVDGTTHIDGRAFNVSPTESALQKVMPAAIAQSLPVDSYQYITAAESADSTENRKFEWQDLLLVACGLVLAMEQALAYRLGFHRSQG